MSFWGWNWHEKGKFNIIYIIFYSLLLCMPHITKKYFENPEYNDLAVTQLYIFALLIIGHNVYEFRKSSSKDSS